MFDWKQTREWNDFIWYWYSNIVMLVPMTLLFFYKLLRPIDYDLMRKPDFKVRSKFGDWSLTTMVSYCLFYYVLDSGIRIITANFNTPCDLVMLFHHLISLVYLPTIIFCRHWTWFTLGPAMVHAYLIAFPDVKFFNYVYITIIILFHFGLYQKPFTNLKEFHRMKTGILWIESVCVCFWLFDCNNCLVNCVP